GVDAAARGFEFVDDLHGADFGRAGDGSGRETGGESVEAIDVGAQPPVQAGDQVHDMRIALDKFEALDLHGAVFADAAEVIAAEVHQHDVFGKLLGIGGEVGGQTLVLGFVSAAPARAGDGPVVRI